MRLWAVSSSQGYGFSSSHVWVWELDYKELMLLNYGVGEDSWESLGLQGDPNQFIQKISPECSLQGLMLKLKLQYFCHLIWRADSFEDPDARKDWRQEEKGSTEDEMVGWHHQLNGHGFAWTPGVGDGQEAWCAAVHGVAKSQTRLSDWTEPCFWVCQSLQCLSSFLDQLLSACKIYLSKSTSGNISREPSLVLSYKELTNSSYEPPLFHIQASSFAYIFYHKNLKYFKETFFMLYNISAEVIKP